MTDREVRTNSIFVFIFGFTLGVFISSFAFISPLLGLLVIIVGIAVLAGEKTWNGHLNKEVLFIGLIFLSFGLGTLRYSIKDFHERLVP